MAASGRRPDAGRTASAGRHPEPYTLCWSHRLSRPASGTLHTSGLRRTRLQTSAAANRVVRLRTDWGSCSSCRGGFQTRPGARDEDHEVTLRSDTCRGAFQNPPPTSSFSPMSRKRATPFRKSCAVSKHSPLAVTMNVPASVASCGSAATTSTSFATRKHWIAFAITSRIILRGGRMTRTTSHERRLPKQGGFETRPCTSRDLCASTVIRRR